MYLNVAYLVLLGSNGDIAPWTLLWRAMAILSVSKYRGIRP
jgi:hypothetical protein